MAPALLDVDAIASTADPFPVYAAQRADAPAVRADNGFWIITGYDEVDAVLRSPAATSGFIGQRYRQMLPEGSAARAELGNRINFLDPPDHTRVRALVSKAFTPRRIDELRPWIAATARRLLVEAGRRSADGTVDLLDALAHPLPSLVISELLGVPDADRDRLSVLTEDSAPLLGLTVSGDAMRRGLAASEEFGSYVEDLLAERRKQPGNDLLSALVAAEDEGDRLDHDELVSLVVTLYAAGHRTTRDLFSTGFAALLAGPPEQRRFALTDPKAAAEEFVRWATPTHFVARVLVEPVDAAGVEIPAFEPVVLFLAAANRDPRKWTDPDTFDVTRPPGPPPLSFAWGAHFCLGAALARAEVQEMIAAVLSAHPDLVPATDDHGWWAAGPFRGLRSLRVSLGSASSG